MQFGVALIADPQAPQVVKPGEGSLNDPAFFAQARAVHSAAPGDHGLHATRPELAAVLVMVIASIGEQPLGASSRTPRPAGDWADTIDQGQQLGDVVAVPAGQADRERNAVRVGDQMVL
jgi:hypothetical protein